MLTIAQTLLRPGRKLVAPVAGGSLALAVAGAGTTAERSKMANAMGTRFAHNALSHSMRHQQQTRSLYSENSKRWLSDSKTGADKGSARTVQSAAPTQSPTTEALGSGAPGAPKGAASQSFLAWYEHHLQARPVLTKMVTGSILWGVGDAVAQAVPQVTTQQSKAAGDRFTYDVPRTTRAVVFGFSLHAPLSHLHFNFLEWMTVQAGVKGYGIPFFKAFMEQFVYWSWFSNSLYHAAMGAMQGMNASQIYRRIEDVLWETQVAQWSFWIPIQLLNFQFVPVRHQLNVVLLTSIVWTALLSAWYPPVQQAESSEEVIKDVHKQLVLKGAEQP